MKKQLLLTGAFGLVGSNICKILERDYPDIEITKSKGASPIEGVTSSNDSRFKQYDYIIFGAGYGQPLKFSSEKLETIRINTTEVDKCFDFLKKSGKFLYISSSEVYSGSLSPHKETDIGTTTPQHPRACYIEGKRCGEAICMAYKGQGYDVKIARLALAYGPGTKKGDTRVLNQFIEQALTTGEIRMKDDGSAVRTYGYVESIANMLLDILFKGKSVVYNVGGTTKISVLKLAKDIAYWTNAKAIIPGPESVEGSPDSVELNLNKIFDEFPHTFLWSWEDGLKKTIEYQKELYAR